jgi:hypothetical protein
MHVHLGRGVTNGNMMRSRRPPASLTSGHHVEAAGRRGLSRCTAKALLMSWCPDRGRIRSRAPTVTGMEGMTPADTQVVQFSLGLDQLSAIAMHVHTGGYFIPIA